MSSHQMMTCAVCCQMFHSFCVGVASSGGVASSMAQSSFTCPLCVTCAVCGDGENVSVGVV